jgi:hypothetical protein
MGCVRGAAGAQELLATARAHYATAEEQALARVRGAARLRRGCGATPNRTRTVRPTLTPLAPSRAAAGVHTAIAHPAAAAAAGGAALLLALPPSRRALYAATIGRVRSADSQAASAARRAAALRELLDAQAKELGKLTERVQLAQDEFARGRGKLVAAGSQLRSLAATSRTVEDKAALLLDDLRHMRALPGAQALRAEVAAAAAAAAKQRGATEKHLKKVACVVPV